MVGQFRFVSPPSPKSSQNLVRSRSRTSRASGQSSATPLPTAQNCERARSQKGRNGHWHHRGGRRAPEPRAKIHPACAAGRARRLPLPPGDGWRRHHGVRAPDQVATCGARVVRCMIAACPGVAPAAEKCRGRRPGTSPRSSHWPLHDTSRIMMGELRLGNG